MGKCRDCIHHDVCKDFIDTAFDGFLDEGEEKIIQDHVETISIGYFADGVELYQFDGIKTDGYFSDFGKTVFLTREEAEQALNKTMQVLAASDS